MPSVQKIISGNDQPSAGRAIVSIAGMNGLGASGTLMTEISSTNIFNPPVSPSKLDPPVAWFNYLDTKFDEINYYYNSGAY